MQPLAAGIDGCYRRYDWGSDALAERRVIPSKGIVLVEGVYALIPPLKDYYHLTVWMDCPRELRPDSTKADDEASGRDHRAEERYMKRDVSLAFIERSAYQIDHARDKINHCLDQLRTEDVWWAPRDGCNPIGVIIRHLMGNLRQWAISAMGGEPDVRDRPTEFHVLERVPKDELQAEFNGVLDRVREVYSGIGVSDLLAPKRIQGFDTMTLDAIYETMCHLELHAGQVLYLTRLRLGDEYVESWVPATDEQGRERS